MSKTTPRNKAARRSLTTKIRRAHRYVLLGGGEDWQNQLGRDQTVICSDCDSMREAVERSSQDSVWISWESARTEQLLQTIGTFLASHAGSHRKFGSLFMLKAPKPRTLPSLYGWFDNVIGEVPSFKMLPIDQLIEVFSAPEKPSCDVFVGGIVDPTTNTLALVRGNLERLTVPLSIFRPSGSLSPDFKHFKLGDYGHTLRFGDYEATADIVLWETSPDYRKRAKARQRVPAKGFGPSLRRLRIQRGLSQSEFPHVARKTISQIEKGEIETHRGTTLNRIAKALGVTPEEIETY